jgi:hypothetical protein
MRLVVRKYTAGSTWLFHFGAMVAENITQVFHPTTAQAVVTTRLGLQPVWHPAVVRHSFAREAATRSVGALPTAPPDGIWQDEQVQTAEKEKGEREHRQEA